MSNTKSIVNNKLLLVEGKDEVRTLTHFLKELSITGIQVFDICGKTNFDSELKLLVRQSNFATVEFIGIVRDADSNFEQSMQSIIGILANNGFKIGKNINGLPQVSVYLMPGNSKNGCIEEMFLNSKSDDPINECINRYFECIDSKRAVLCSGEKLSKAKMSVFLAANASDPDKRFGESVQAGFWDINHSAFIEFITFLRSI